MHWIIKEASDFQMIHFMQEEMIEVVFYENQNGIAQFTL